MKFEDRMRALEVYHSLKVPKDKYIILRIDGRSFSALTEKYFEKPVDRIFQDMMLSTTKILVEKMGALYGFVESDEISILLPRDTDFFDREQEKLVSVSAGIASSWFAREFYREITADGDIPHFDSRLIECAHEKTVVDYFLWRQADAQRCALNGMTYWMLRKNGYNASKATKLMNGMNRDTKIILLKEYGIYFNNVHVEYKNGSGVVWESYEKEGFNPITKETVIANRTRTKVLRGLPSFDEYVSLLLEIMDKDYNRINN